MTICRLGKMFVILLQLLDAVWKYWPLGNFMCYAIYILYHVCMVASALTLTAMPVDM